MSQLTEANRKGIRRTVLVLLAIISGIVGFWFYEQTRQPGLDDLDATVLTQPRALKPFQLIDDRNKKFTNAQLEGKWSLLFFGFTHCPDICPTTLSVLNNVEALFKQAHDEPPQVVFVSVDPKRDTPKHLRQYINYFNPAFKAVTGTVKSIQALTKELGIVYTLVPARGEKALGDDYLVDHSGAVLLIDPQVRLHAIFTTPDNADKIAKEIRIIEKTSAVEQAALFTT